MTFFMCTFFFAIPGENKEYSQEFKPRRDEHIDPVPDFVSESGSSDLEYEFNDDILG